MGGSTEGNQADVGPGNSSVVGNLSVEEGNHIDDVSLAEDVESKSNPTTKMTGYEYVKNKQKNCEKKKDTVSENQKDNQSGTGDTEEVLKNSSLEEGTSGEAEMAGEDNTTDLKETKSISINENDVTMEEDGADGTKPLI